MQRIRCQQSRLLCQFGKQIMAVILGLICLIALNPITALAGDPRGLFMAASTRYTITANAINGVTAISNAGATDTGTGNGISVGTNAISIPADCDAFNGGTSSVSLYVNGTEADSLDCFGGDSSGTLTASVTGTYSAQVVGILVGDGSFSAGPFTLPTALTDWTIKPPAGTALRTDGHWSVNGLVGAWPFNEGSGTSAADLVGSHTAVLNGTGTVLDANGLTLGTSGYAETDTPLINPPVFTVVSEIYGRVAWGVIGSFGGSAAGKGWDVGFGSTTDHSKMTFGNVNDYTVSSLFNSGDDSTWIKTAWSCSGNGGQFTAYKNGVAGTPVTVSTMQTPASKPFTIGAAHNNTSYLDYYSGGKIKYLWLYNRALNSTEIASLSANPYQIFAPH